MTDGAGGDPFQPSSFDELEELVEIGRGGFAVVFRASQPRFGRTVAVKVIDSAADEKAVERFERECAAMGMLSSHPNIVTVFDAGVRDSGEPYLVMEYMPDGSYDDRLRNGALGWQEVADVGVKLAGALETAHDATILHRDVKPANVLTSSFGEPCLGDFGLARFHGGQSTAGVVSATLLHAPPEVLAGTPATPQSDLYSLASTLYTLMAGRAPFHREDDESVLPLFTRIAEEAVPDLRPRGVPASVCAALEQAMAKRPGDRQVSLAAFAEELREAQREEGLTPTPLRVNQGSAAEAAKSLRPGSATTSTGDGRHTITVAAPGAPAPAAADSGETISVVGAPPPPTPAPPPAPAVSTPLGKRPRRKGLLALVALVVAVVIGGGLLAVTLRGDERADDSPATSDAAPTTTTAARVSRRAATDELTAQVNEFRVSQGLEALETDADLAAAALEHATEVAATGRLTQTDLDALAASLPGQFTILGENVLSGGSVDEVQESSTNSAAQREILENPLWDSMGIGIAFSADRTTVFAVEYFGQRSSG